ncbi:MAG: carboxypeptidase-like regulatory domain-containing protein, partial [Bacteroidia bacterium]|nr:carboxypeptidase-like regulatory domain-containing protein [Bacteroidia bacterium]
MKKLIPLILISLLFACQQDDLSGPMIPDSMNQDDLAFQQNFGLTTTANFIGRVVNADGNQIAGVQITIGNDMSLTDHNGVFVMNNVSVFEKFAHVKAIKQGYLPGSRSLVPVIDGSNDVRIVLLEKNVVATVDSGTGELVSYDGTSVYLPGDFTDSSGNPYSGQVEVSMHYLAPNQNSTFEQMPGSLFGQELDNDAVMLETYGMLGID